MNVPACLLSSRQAAIDAFLREQCKVQRITAGMRKLVEHFIIIKQHFPKIETKPGSPEVSCIPANRMQQLCRNYEPIRNAVCIMLPCASKDAKRCNRIIGWTEAFNDFIIELWSEQLKWEMKQRQARKALNRVEFHFMPGADLSRYSKTEKSNRHYFWAQNIKRDDKSKLYGPHGCIDFDLVAAHFYIFCMELMQSGEGHPMIDLFLRDPDHFHQLIIDHEAMPYAIRTDSSLTPQQKAKASRNALMMPPNNGTPQPVGVKWYDELRAFVHARLKECCIEGETPHQLLTAIEARILQQAFDAIGREKVCLNMHDGFIAMGVEDIEAAVQMLQEATGYKWKATLL